MAQYKTKAIVLKAIKLGESDKILSLYSPEHGLIKAIAKGARKSTSSHGIKSQVLSYCEFLLGTGRNLDIISQSQLLESFQEIRNDYDKLTAACFLVDVIDSTAIEDNHYEDHFNLLLRSLQELNNTSSDAHKVSLKFIWALIEQLGYKPDLDNCSLSHNKKPVGQAAQYFDLENGAITSTQAFKEFTESNPYQSDIVKIEQETYWVLKNLETHDIDKHLEDQDKNQEEQGKSEQSIKSALKLLHKHLEYRIHKEFKSWKVMESIL